VEFDVQRAVRGTVLHTVCPAGPHPARFETSIAVTGETTFAALHRLAPAGDGTLACLNFSSAKNPGGGFLSGSQAQEESLARSSALYPCLLTVPEFYARNRAHRSALYLDPVIYSPDMPFFRDDTHALLEEPAYYSVLTSPAPNAGAVKQNEPKYEPLVAVTLRRCAKWVLSVAAHHGNERLVLGAWGCGVFRNDPAMVAGAFKDLLQAPGEFAGVFRTVVFAVYDPSPAQPNLTVFRNVFET
jgi:uncharacterized protein (TIGR02452 family)